MTTAFELADQYVVEVASMIPPMATALGVPGHDHEWGSFLSPDGVEAIDALNRRFRGALEPHLGDQDPTQRLAAKVTMGWVEERIADHEAGDHFHDLRHMGCSFQNLRGVFDLMPKTTTDDWDAIRSRLRTIEKPLLDYRSTLDEGRRRGLMVAQRQVRSVIEQADHLAGPQSAFLDLSAAAQSAGIEDGSADEAVDTARSAVASFAGWLRSVYLPDAPIEDGVGESAYVRAANRLLGMAVDPHEAYEWGWEELHRLLAEMDRVGDLILPGAGWQEARELLETEPSGLADSPEALLDYVRELLAGAVEDLAGTHFDVPAEIRPLTVQLTPPGGPRSVYYIAPSEDFKRPGGVWYSLGGETLFPLYHHTSTAYHEAFPGHHLQIATAMYDKESLSRAQRVLTWYPGFGEGWGMYAEVLMGELGYLEDPSHYFGMLAKQMYRAARVVVDIGLHLGLTTHSSSMVAPGERWTFESAVEVMRVYGFQTAGDAEAEVLRYLGWAGQAISYKLGEREMLRVRAETMARLGSSFDLKAFHAAVLSNGPMRFDTLRENLAEVL